MRDGRQLTRRGNAVAVVAAIRQSGLLSLTLLLSLLLPGSAFADDRRGRADAHTRRRNDTSSEWTYEARSADREFQRPLTPVGLTIAQPNDLRVAVTFQASKPWFGEVRFGTPNSHRVAVVVDEGEDGDVDIYVDRNRNRVIEAKDKIDGVGVVRTSELLAEIWRDDEGSYLSRTVQWRWGAATRQLSVGTAGFLAGQVRLEERQIAVRRVDGDANGFFGDAADRVWFDWNADGQWEPFTEQFPNQPILTVNGQRFTLRSDEFGQRLTCEPITGIGTLKLGFPQLTAGSALIEANVMLVGDDGSAVTLKSPSEPLPVPIGRYAVQMLSLSLRGESTGRDDSDRRWHFTFSRPRSRAPTASEWFSVGKDQTLTIDPIGFLRMTIDLEHESVEVGQSLSVRPRLTTSTGLLINICRRGDKHQPMPYGTGPMAKVSINTANGNELTAASSGFA